MAKKKYAQVRHPFLYRVANPDGTHEIKRIFARVVRATRDVAMVIDEPHVLKSMELNGVGNTATCSAAICTYAHRDDFPHPVIGFTDWTYSRAFIVSKRNQFGLPIECYAYEHDDEIARMNDSKDGQRRLLALIRKNGPITIVLRAYRQRSDEGRPGRGRKATGARSPEKRLGANRRYFTAQLGVLPQ
jgi:hypothetical protein